MEFIRLDSLVSSCDNILYLYMCCGCAAHVSSRQCVQSCFFVCSDWKLSKFSKFEDFVQVLWCSSPFSAWYLSRGVMFCEIIFEYSVPDSVFPEIIVDFGCFNGCPRFGVCWVIYFFYCAVLLWGWDCGFV